MQESFHKIKQTVQSFLPDAQVLLFGSKAKGTANPSSDFDVLVITKHNYSPPQKIKFNNLIHKALVAALKSPVDLIMHSEEEVKVYQNYFGHIVRYAVKEGIML